MARAYGYLLEDKTINAYLRARVDDDAIGVRNEEPSANVGLKRDFRPSHNGPKPVTQRDEFGHSARDKSASTTPILIAADSQ